MFRKSITFFILVGLLWLLLWTYVPDWSPEQLSVTDFLRGFWLLFAVMAWAFALLIAVIRFKGIDLLAAVFPQSRIALWLGKQAYAFSQPKTVIHITYHGPDEECHIVLKVNQQRFEYSLSQKKQQAIALGYIKDNPTIKWQQAHSGTNKQVLMINTHLKKLGRNQSFELHITDNQLQIAMVNQDS